MLVTFVFFVSSVWSLPGMDTESALGIRLRMTEE